MPLIPFHWALVQNIKRDPFEQAVGVAQQSAQSLGGALSGPVTAYTVRLEPAAYRRAVVDQSTSCRTKEYPPLQAPATYNLDGIMETGEERPTPRSTSGSGVPENSVM